MRLTRALLLVLVLVAARPRPAHGEAARPCALLGSSGRFSLQPSTAACSLSVVSTQRASSFLAVQGPVQPEIGRPAAVQLAAPASGEGALDIAPGGLLLLQDLLLLNASLASPAQEGNPNNAFLPAELSLPLGAKLRLRDVVLVTGTDTLQAYVSFLSGLPAVTLLTDGLAWLHVLNYSSPPFGVVEVLSLTLIAPRAATIEGVSLTLLRSQLAAAGGPRCNTTGIAESPARLASGGAQPLPVSAEAAAAACGDAAGVTAVTDNFVLGASNRTLLPLLRRLGGAGSQPLLVLLAANATLSPAAWGPAAWPPGSLVLRRPVAWVGSSSRTTSIDFGMEVGQVVLAGPSANATLINLALENLAYGDQDSLADAEGNSILLSNRLWSFKYKRSAPRIVLHNVVEVLPEQRQIDNVIYWVNAFNSDLPIWRDKTSFLRDTLKYTVIKYTTGRRPGEFTILLASSKDQFVSNVTYSVTPVAAAPLPLPFNASLHQPLLAGSVDPVIGAVGGVQDLVLTLWNQRNAACSRLHILLPSRDSISLAPSALPGLQTTPAPATAAADAGGGDAAAGGGSAAGALPPLPPPAQELQQAVGNGTSVAAASSSNSSSTAGPAGPLPLQWPPPGGTAIACPVQLRGSAARSQMLDAAYSPNLFRILPGQAEPDLNSSTAATAAAAAAAAAATAAAAQGAPAGGGAAATGTLQLLRLKLVRLPQGGGLAGRAPPPGPALARPQLQVGSSNSPWLSALPPQAWTHLLWFIARDLNVSGSSAGGAAVVLANVTLLLPPLEVEQLAVAAAGAAADSSTPGATFIIAYPSSEGVLRVIYRDATFQQPGLGAAPAQPAMLASPTAGGPRMLRLAPRRRSLLQAQPLVQQPSPAPADVAAGNSMLCVGLLEGAGLTGRNVCMAAQPLSEMPLQPGLAWVTAAGAAPANPWPAWQAAVVVLAVALPLLALAAFAARQLRRRRPTGTGASKAAAAAAAAGSLLGIASTAASSAGKDAAAASGWLPSVSSGGSSEPRILTARLAAGTDSGEGSSGSLLLARLRDCCPGSSSAEGSSADTAAAGGSSSMSGRRAAAAAAAMAAGDSAGTAGRRPSLASSAGSTSSSQASQPDSAGAVAGSVVVVSLGEQLGQLAAAHLATLEGSADDAPAAARAGTRSSWQGPAPFTGLTAGLPAALAGAGVAGAGARQPAQLLQQLAHELRQQPPAPVPVPRPAATPLGAAQRISSAISSVSADIQGRRGLGIAAGGLPPSCGSRLRSSIDEDAQLPQQQLQEQREITPASPPLPPGSRARGQAGARRSSEPRSLAVRSLTGGASGSSGSASQLQLHEVIGAGSFGVVYRATWRGIPVAVKVMNLPGTGVELQGLGSPRSAEPSRREAMAVMEAALGSSLSHPNIIQVYTYLLRPLTSAATGADAEPQTSSSGGEASRQGGSSEGAPGGAGKAGRQGSGASASSASGAAVVGYELQLVMEYAPLGSLRAAIDSGLLDDRLTGRPHYATVLSLALGVARAMSHLHSEGVLHGDLKAGNVLLKAELRPAASGASGGSRSSALPGSTGADASSARSGSGSGHGALLHQEQLVAKVADFGLAIRMADCDTHISGVHRGTLASMAPELLLHGRASRASDAYAFGILLYEMATGLRAFADVPRALLGAHVLRDRARPEWPDGSSSLNLAIAASAAAAAAAGTAHHEVLPPPAFRQLAEACWAHEPRDRPSFDAACDALEALLAEEGERAARLAALVGARAAGQARPGAPAAPAAPAGGGQAQAPPAPHSPFAELKDRAWSSRDVSGQG